MASKSRRTALLQGKCVYCGSRDNLTIDHIIPQAMTRILGVDRDKDNLQVLCQPCNVKKGDSLKSNDLVTVRLLEKLISQWKFLHAPVRKPRNYVFRNLPVVSLTPEIIYYDTR